MNNGIPFLVQMIDELQWIFIKKNQTDNSDEIHKDRETTI